MGVSFGVGGPSQMGQHNMNDVGRKPELSKSLAQQVKKVNCSYIYVPENVFRTSLLSMCKVHIKEVHILCYLIIHTLFPELKRERSR